MLAHNDNYTPLVEKPEEPNNILGQLQSSKSPQSDSRLQSSASPIGANVPAESKTLFAGRSLKQTRRQRGLSQCDLADLIGVSQGRISAWENGRDDIPYKVRLKLIDVFSNKRGLLDRFVRKLIDTDPYVSVFEPVTTDGLADLSYLHLAQYPRFAFRDPVAAIGQRVSTHFQTTRLVVSREKFMMDAERDIITNRQFGSQAVMRVRSQQMYLEFEGYPNLVIARHVTLGQSTGAPMIIHNQLMLNELDSLP